MNKNIQLISVVNNKSLRFSVLLLMVVSLIGVPIINAYSSVIPKPGATCSPKGLTVTAGGKLYKCVASGKKLVWNSGVKISTPTSTTTSTTPPTTETSQSEAVAIASAKWTSNVTATIGAGSWNYKTTAAIPSQFVATNYSRPAVETNPVAAGAVLQPGKSAVVNNNYNYTLPLTPQWSATTTAAPLGPIGVMLDGGVLFNPFDAGLEPAMSANFSITIGGVTASFLDNCNSHSPMNFHYHAVPNCIVQWATGQSVNVQSVTDFSSATLPAVEQANALTKKPVLVGFAFDGYGVYDNIDMNGNTIPVSSLDACNGIFSPVPGYTAGIYHYVLENIKGARSSVACFHGVVSAAFTQAMQNTINKSGPGGPPQGSPGPNGGPPPQGLLTSNAKKSYALGNYRSMMGIKVNHVVTARDLAANPQQIAFLLAKLKSIKNNLC
jgi:YHYH protein